MARQLSSKTRILVRVLAITFLIAALALVFVGLRKATSTSSDGVTPISASPRWHGWLSPRWRRWLNIPAVDPPATPDYAGYLKCRTGELTRPAPDSRVTFELVRADPKSQQGDFRVVFDGDPQEFRGVVAKDQVFAFCPKLARIGVHLREINATSAVIEVPGLVHPSPQRSPSQKK